MDLPALNTPAVASSGIQNELIKAMAMAVGKNCVAYVEVMYPEAIEHTSSTFKLSLRNHIYKDIMHVSTLHTEREIREWLKRNEEHHKQWLATWRKLRRDGKRKSAP